MIQVCPPFKISAKPVDITGIEQNKLDEYLNSHVSEHSAHYIPATPLDRLVIRFSNLSIVKGNKPSIMLYLSGHAGYLSIFPVELTKTVLEKGFVPMDEALEHIHDFFDVIRIGILSSHSDIEVHLTIVALENEEMGQFLNL